MTSVLLAASSTVSTSANHSSWPQGMSTRRTGWTQSLLLGPTQVVGPAARLGVVHQREQALHDVAYEAEAPGLLAVAVDGDRLALDGLADKSGG